MKYIKLFEDSSKLYEIVDKLYFDNVTRISNWCNLTKIEIRTVNKCFITIAPAVINLQCLPSLKVKGSITIDSRYCKRRIHWFNFKL